MIQLVRRPASAYFFSPPAFKALCDKVGHRFPFLQPVYLGLAGGRYAFVPRTIHPRSFPAWREEGALGRIPAFLSLTALANFIETVEVPLHFNSLGKPAADLVRFGIMPLLEGSSPANLSADYDHVKFALKCVAEQEAGRELVYVDDRELYLLAGRRLRQLEGIGCRREEFVFSRIREENFAITAFPNLAAFMRAYQGPPASAPPAVRRTPRARPAGAGDSGELADDPSGVKLPAGAVELRQRIRDSNRLLLFTRNISIEELRDMHRANCIRSNGHDRGVKYFRYGLGHEYGSIVVVMKPAFWQAERGTSGLVDVFEIKKRLVGPGARGKKATKGSPEQMTTILAGLTEEGEDPQGLLEKLIESVEYNRCLRGVERIGEDSTHRAGMTVMLDLQPKLMGMYPQLEVEHDIGLEMVEAILVPEHLWDTVRDGIGEGTPVAGLLRKVDGTGKDETGFLSGRERLVRRSRMYSGKWEPQFGYESLFLFEQAYFSLVAAQPELSNTKEYDAYRKEVSRILAAHGFAPRFWQWISGVPPAGVKMIARDPNGDWKIFVNPRQECFWPVLGAVCAVLQGVRPNYGGIEFKLPLDLHAEWRAGRKFGEVGDTPKIVIYVNAETLAPLLACLELTLSSNFSDAGFRDVRPSFTRPYGGTDLLSYKMESFARGFDERAAIADRAGRRARRNGITNEAEILRLKRAALRAAGFGGTNFHARNNVFDPVLGRIVRDSD